MAHLETKAKEYICISEIKIYHKIMQELNHEKYFNDNMKIGKTSIPTSKVCRVYSNKMKVKVVCMCCCILFNATPHSYGV